MSYNTNFVLTYHLIKEDLELSEDLYRSQFLQAFNLDKWDDTIINKETEKIFNKYNINSNFREIFDLIKNENTIFSQIILFYGDNCNNIDLFKLLYNFETFYLLHKYICDIENNKIDNNKFINEIIKKIKE